MRVLIFLVLAFASMSADALELSQVRASVIQFAPSKEERADVLFALDMPARVSLSIYDGRDLLIRRVRSDGELAAGEQHLSWDGRDEAGRLVPDEAYHYTLLAETAAGDSVVHDLTDITGGDDLKAEQVTWDSETKLIRYRLPKAGRVNVRVGLENDGPLLRTIVDWVARPAGDHTEHWDGWDQSHVLDLTEHPRLQIGVDAFALGDNTLFVGKAERIELIDPIKWVRENRERAPEAKRMHFHSQQPLEARGDVAVTLSLGDRPVAGGRIPSVSGIVPIRLDVPDADRQRVLDRRFEPVFFVDGQFVFENEVGFLPTTWLWNTTTASEGIHYITANVRGYEGNFGMATIAVRVIRETEQ